MSSYEQQRKRYDAAGQSQVFAFWDKLDSQQQEALLQQASALDVERVNTVYARAIESEKDAAAAEAAGAGAGKIEPPPAKSVVSTTGDAAQENALRNIGLDAIAKGQVGVLLMAGGQGTRLGSSAPKGCYDIGLPSHKSLFQLQAERIARLQVLATEKAGKKDGEVVVPWYIMTSGPTRRPTEDFFAEHNYFGLGKENVIFFEQGTLPCLTMEGKIMLDTTSRIATAPDGNGGLYTSLRAPLSPSTSTTVLSSLSSRGIKYLHAYGVDNCLVKVGDPVFLGACLSKGVKAGVKTVRKVDPSESVGVVALRDGKFGVIEYSEIPASLSTARDADGELLLRAANIVNHFYTTEFLSTDVPAFEAHMAFHIARKKIPSLDSAGNSVKPASPNGMKLELFVFDVFPYVDDLTILEVQRQDEFSPLKNAPNTGTDDPQTSRRDLLALQRRWLEAAHAQVKGDAEVEISPLVSYGGEGLEKLRGLSIDTSRIIDEL